MKSTLCATSTNQRDKIMQALLGIGGFILFMGYSILQIVAGYVGIDFHFGAVWYGVAIVAALMFRFTLPITIGAFFGAMDVWGWHWGFAALFAAPGLAFLIPGVILSIIEGAFANRPTKCKKETVYKSLPLGKTTEHRQQPDISDNSKNHNPVVQQNLLEQEKPDVMSMDKGVYKNALMAIEYRPEAKMAFDSIEELPEEYKIKFLELLEDNPKGIVDDFIKIVRDKYSDWLTPYENENTNSILQDVRKLGCPAAEQEFKEIIDVLDTSVDPREIFEKIKKKHEGDHNKLQPIKENHKDEVGINDYDNNGTTPLIRAINEGNINTVKRLLELGANPKIEYMGSTLAGLARQKKNNAIIDLLEDNLYQNVWNEIINNAPERELWEKSVATSDSNENQIKTNYAKLRIAQIKVLLAYENKKKQVQSEINEIQKIEEIYKGGVGINDYDNNGTTPLIRAINEGNINTVKRLLELGANPKIEYMGSTLAGLARQRKRDDIQQLLKSHNSY